MVSWEKKVAHWRGVPSKRPLGAVISAPILRRRDTSDAWPCCDAQQREVRPSLSCIAIWLRSGFIIIDSCLFVSMRCLMSIGRRYSVIIRRSSLGRDWRVILDCGGRANGGVVAMR